MARYTLEQLWLGSMKLSPWRRNYSQSPRRQINQIVPFLGTKTVLFTASFNGLTEKSVHLSNILFMDCEIIEESIIKPQSETIIQPQNTTQQSAVVETKVNKPQPYGGVVNAEPNYSTATHFKVTYNGKNYWIKKIDMKIKPILVRCSCSDYYFVFSWSNFKNGVQFGGKARPYVRVSPPSNRPPRNPHDYQGICKHLAQFSAMLQGSGYAI